MCICVCVCVFQTNFQLFILNYFSLKSIRSCTFFFNVAVVFSPARREYNFNLSPLSREYTLIQAFASPNNLKIKRKIQSVNIIIMYFRKTSGPESRYILLQYNITQCNLPVIIFKKNPLSARQTLDMVPLLVDNNYKRTHSRYFYRIFSVFVHSRYGCRV